MRLSQAQDCLPGPLRARWLPFQAGGRVASRGQQSARPAGRGKWEKVAATPPFVAKGDR